MCKKNIATLLVILFFCFWTGYSHCYGQNDFISLKNFTPPSPEAAALGRFGEVANNFSTGVPQINIPLYEIKSGKLSLPVSLSYNASGIRVHDVATPVGLGWVLNAGGEVSRNVVGIADEFGLLGGNYSYYKNRSYYTGKTYSSTDFLNLSNFSSGIYDSQSDVYNYTAGDVSGKFVYDTAKQVHYTPVDREIKISMRSDTTFTIVDDEGSIYIYSNKLRTENLSGATNNITSWQLSKILSADRRDSICFFYQTAFPSVEAFASHGFSITANPVRGDMGCELSNPSASYNFSSNTYTHQRSLIDSITFKNGYLKFRYLNDRTDLLPERLDQLWIGNINGVLKKIKLGFNYFLSDADTTHLNAKYTRRLRLDSVKIQDKNSVDVNVYSLKYNSKQLPPYHTFSSDGEHPSTETDFWGYYNANGAYGITKTLLPANYGNHISGFLSSRYYSVSNSILSEYNTRSSNKEVNPDVIDACMLQRISYPTGAYTVFSFESNRVSDTGATYVGGLRLRTMVSFDTINRQPVVKSYRYDSANLISPVSPHDFYYEVKKFEPINTVYCQGAVFYIAANPIGPINYYNGSPVVYGRVTEYNGFPGDNSGSTVYVFDTDLDSIYNVDLNKYWNFSTDKSWARGNLLNTKIYKVENGNNILIKEVKNHYTSLGTSKVKVGQICEATSFNNANLEFYIANPYYYINYGDQYLLSHFDYADVVLPFGVKKLIKSEEIDYLNNNLILTKEYLYNGSNHLYKSATLTSTSRTNDTLAEILKYPLDKSQIGGQSSSASIALDSMVSRNIVNIPIDIEQKRNNIHLTQNRITFRNWNNSGRFYEEFRYSQKGTGLLEERLNNKAYDEAGNTTTVSQTHGSDIAYIWDYNKAYPVAKIDNANVSMVAYTSFETNEGGNWDISGGATTSIFLTGKKSYNIANGGPSKSNLPTGKRYIVSYWSTGSFANVNWFNGAYTQSGTAIATTKKTKDGWTLYEHILPNTTAHVSLSGNVTIDELRLYPEDAQMTSYTYEPLIGVTSSCNPADIITYYEYDDFGRLKTILDQDKNIVKALEYKYNKAEGEGVNGWLGTDSIGAFTINGHITGIVTKQEKDFNSSSPTYNQKRWVPYDFSPQEFAEWISTGDSICLTYGGDTTGYLKVKYVDVNPYTSTYLKNKWVTTYNTTRCPLPCVGPRGKMINGICEWGVRVDTGSYWDGSHWNCFYHYEWSDSSYSETFTEFRNDECPMSQ